MKFENEHEKKIYQSSFFAGKNSATPKPNYTQEELEEMKTYINTCLDALINDFAEGIDQIYRFPDWFKKIPILKKLIEEKEKHLEDWVKVRNFLCYVQTKTLPEYLEHINTRKDK